MVVTPLFFKKEISFEPPSRLRQHPNHPHIILGHFLVVYHQYGEKTLRTNVHDPKHENLPKLETNPK